MAAATPAPGLEGPPQGSTAGASAAGSEAAGAGTRREQELYRPPPPGAKGGGRPPRGGPPGISAGPGDGAGQSAAAADAEGAMQSSLQTSRLSDGGAFVTTPHCVACMRNRWWSPFDHVPRRST